MKEFPRKFLSLRDKNGTGRRSKSVAPAPSVPAIPDGTGNKSKPRPLSTGVFMAMFKKDGAKQEAKAEAEKEKDQARVEEILRRLDELNITNVTADHVTDIMATKFADHDPDRTVEFIDMEQKAAAGIITPYDPSVDMVGAENRGNVTCYLDALLFSMFAKIDAFECMLKNEFPEEDSRNKLVNLLRMWVNMLRAGKLVHTDMTKLIQDALADCGWSDARMLEQQDTSEAFAFITETLQLPLLSLQVDLFHQGKKDKDDHKVVYERLLNLAIPADPEDRGLKLEDCLEEYFNAQVDVKRDSEDGKKLGIDEKSGSWTPTLKHRDTIRIITEERGESSTPTSPLVFTPLDRTPTAEKGPLLSPTDPSLKNGDTPDDEEEGEVTTVELVPTKPTMRGRSTSVIQRVVLDEEGRPATPDNATMLQKAMRKGSTVVKAVTIPAWQFFRLIPWHALSSTEPKNNTEVALNFEQRPVVGICLKRYAMTESGQPKRHNTFIDIPDSLRLPHFMLADEPKADEDMNVLNTDYKLVLQSVICHRGDSLQSGHYVSFARVAPKLLKDNRRHNFDPPPDYEEAQWVKFDDLQIENRVSYVDDIRSALKEEMPYLLFYQVMPMVEVAPPSVDETETEPPSYNDSKVSIELPPTPSRSNRLGSLEEGYFDNTPIFTNPQYLSSKPPSIRLSMDSERPRRSEDAPDRQTRSLAGDSRRPSAVWNESTSHTPNSHSPAVTPAITPNEESTASRLSRAASRFTLVNRSRPSSQNGENRLSFSMSRLGGLMRASKDPLAEPKDELNSIGMSSANSTGVLTAETSKESGESKDVEDGNEQPAEPEPEHHHHRHHGHKHGHKRVKSKEKNKGKGNDQPERECSVM
ncbi:ubiquitin carboxyl-terminal hydrolase-domain-containing protein [Fusarium avenaceum]|nr:ubiquitin carboxyl-terminal hydrolase-domain-containing protein [Fusarium avenaceum]